MFKKSFAAFLLGAAVAVLIYAIYAPARRSPPSVEGVAAADDLPGQQPAPRSSDLESEAQEDIQSLEPEVAAVSSESEPNQDPGSQVARSNPFNLRREIEMESFDPVWAPTAARQITEYLTNFLLVENREFGERYSLTSVRCRSTLCEALLFDYGPDPDASNFEENLHLQDLDLFEQPWIDQFDMSGTKMLYMSESGNLEQRLYLRRKN